MSAARTVTGVPGVSLAAQTGPANMNNPAAASVLLARCNLKHDVVEEADLTDDRLASHRALLVPSAAHLADRKQQEAITAAEQILAKAREASAIEHERTMTQLKRELGRLVVETTAKVTGKVLSPDDQRRLQEEAARTLSA